MIKRNHVIFGVCSYIAFKATIDIDTAISPIALLCVSFGSVFNDIDTPKSWLGRKVWPVSLLINIVTGHRGLTHSLLFVSLLYWFLMRGFEGSNIYIEAFVFGTLSHVLADYLTIEGCPLFYPYKRKFSSPLAIKTGGFLEHVAMLIAASLTSFFTFYTYV